MSCVFQIASTAVSLCTMKKRPCHSYFTSLWIASLLTFSVVALFAHPLHFQWIGSLWNNISAARHVHQFDLLAFDPQCISRAEQWIINGPNSRSLPVSDKLADAWRQYGELHKSCSVGKNWTEILSGGYIDGCKYLLYLDGWEGLGNRILSLTTAFAYALGTNRVLLVDSRRDLSKLLCDPFPGSSWVLPDDFPYWRVENSPSLGPAMRKNFDSRVVRLNLRHTQNRDDSQFFCEGTYSELMKVEWIVWASNQYYLTNLLLVPSFWRRMKALSLDMEGAFTLLSRLVLLPANGVWSLIQREYQGYLSCANSRVGAHVRLEGPGDLAAYDPDASRRILKCLLHNRFLPNITRSPDVNYSAELANFWHRKRRRAGEGTVDVVLLLASLQGEYFRELRKLYRENPTVDGTTVRVHTVSQLGKEDQSFAQAELAMAEMWLLSYSSHLLTSSFSTFGYIAQGFGGLRPYILMMGKARANQSACIRGQSREPCTHYPQKPACLQGPGANLSMEHKRWIKEHIRSCQDHPEGWQLVEGTGAPAAAPLLFDFLQK